MENVCKIPFIKGIMETTLTEPDITSELLSKRWSVVSFEKCEASGLAYAEAMRRMAELDAQRMTGLCIVTDDAAARINSVLSD